MSSTYLAAVKARRTHYPLKKESPIDDTAIQEIVSQAVLHAPSCFNSQSSRAVLLLKDEHEKLWKETNNILKGIVPPEQFEATKKKVDMFEGAYGTVRCVAVLLFWLRTKLNRFFSSFPAP